MSGARWLPLDEHWNGDGYPAGLAGEEISPLARLMCLAQTMEVFWQQRGPTAACAVARERRGTWFDPALVDAVLRVMSRDAGSKLDAVGFGALEAWLARDGARALVDAA
jgi:HD-GYP domain-containing protein (c-di-GMP phosphodiesterase class II)